MNLSFVLRAVRRRWILVVSLVLMGVLGGLLSVLFTPSRYVSTVTIFVSTQAPADNVTVAYQGSLLSEQRVRSYAELVGNPLIAEDVKRKLNSGDPVSVIQTRLSAEVVPDTVLISLSASAPTAAGSAELADTASQSFTALIGELETRAPQTGPPLVTARIVSPAPTPTEAVAPRPAQSILIGLVLGILIGVAAGTAREFLDRSIKSSRQLEEVAERPVLARVSHAEPELVTLAPNASSQISPRVAEEFRQLRTNLQFIDVDRAPQVILVTSSLAGEGKTTTACNLASVLAQAGSSVVLVDCDLRRPQIAERLGLENSVGVTSVLTRRASREAVTQRLAPRFDVIASGPVPPNPSELLGSEAMQGLLADLRSATDFVLVDSPPILPVADASGLAHVCDGVVLVCRERVVTVDQVQEARNRIVAVAGRLLGVVLNGVPLDRRLAYGDYGGYAYVSGTGPPEAGADGRLVDRHQSDERTVGIYRGSPDIGGSKPSPRRRQEYS